MMLENSSGAEVPMAIKVAPEMSEGMSKSKMEQMHLH